MSIPVRSSTIDWGDPDERSPVERDLELCRRILRAVEDAGPEETVTSFDFADDYPESVISEHVFLLRSAGFIEATFVRTEKSWIFMIRRLTWGGHEFICASRDEGRWNRAKERVGKAWGDISFGALQKFLDALTLESLGLLQAAEAPASPRA